ncbi:MAG: hypothetical protein H8Z69_02940 [Nanohaloarchaea archaeon]|nr:hypothetical protein [Candidatus Nanohaloarchaea archaeon]
MRDPWKYIAFPIAAVSGYFVSIAATQQVKAYLGLSDFLTRVIVLAAVGLIAGFMVDEVIPAYIEKVKGSQGGVRGDDFGGGGGGDDFDFDN